MKIALPIFVFLTCLAVSCLALKNNKRQGWTGHPPPPHHRGPAPPGRHRGPPPPPGPPRGQSPPPKKPASLRDDNTDDKAGWGWNGSGWGGNVSCAKPPPCLDPAVIPLSPDIDPDFFTRERLWYYAGGTCFGYNTYFRIFNGRYATSQREVNEMCPAQIYGGAPPVINSGSGVQFTQQCSEEFQQGTCTMDKEDPSTYDYPPVDVNAALATQDYYLVETDSEKYAIYYNCDDYVHGDLQLLSTRPYVDNTTMAAFLSYFALAGIPTSQAQAAICIPPKFQGPYPYPFGWYPNSPGGIGWGQSQDGWQSPSPPSGGWPSSDGNGWSGGSGWPGNNGWSDNGGWSDNSGWSGNGGWSNNGWSDNSGWGSSDVGWGGWNGNGGPSGWGWDSQTNGWGSGWGKEDEPIKEGDKKTEDAKKTGEKKTEDPNKTGDKKESEAVAAEVVAEFNQ